MKGKGQDNQNDSKQSTLDGQIRYNILINRILIYYKEIVEILQTSFQGRKRRL